MSSAPFAPLRQPIPVRVITTGALPAPSPDIALVRIDRPSHEHPDGNTCVACDARGNVRVHLFELLEMARRGDVPMPRAVVVDASHAPDPQSLRDALVPGKLPATGLRDFTVARSFRLVE